MGLSLKRTLIDVRRLWLRRVLLRLRNKLVPMGLQHALGFYMVED